MYRYLIPFCLALTTLGPAQAEPPRVITDIAPVHSLVSIVMQGVGEPDILLPPGASPHDFAMRPSDARKISRAGATIWIGEDFTPWLARSVEALAGDAPSLQLIKVPGTFTLPYREDAVFLEGTGGDAGHDDHDDPAHKDDHHDDHKHDAHKHDAHKNDDHADHKDEHGHDKHGHDDHADHKSEAKVGVALHDHHGHDHGGGVDLHAWQYPENAKTWLDAIAEFLGEIDPDNLIAYRANALAAKQEIDSLTAELTEQLTPLRGRVFVVTHDAYHYFEHRFEIEATAAILPGDGGAASAARMQAISRKLAETSGACIFIEPQMSDSIARSLAREGNAGIATLDPIGDSLERGPGLYNGLLRSIGSSLVDCLS